MLESNGLKIDTEPVQLLEDLKLVLDQNGIQLLHTIKPLGQNIMFSCPSHKGGQERKPSCGMLVSDVHKNGKKQPAGTVHCFTCGYTDTLSGFISLCFGYKDGGVFGNKWLKANYNTIMQENRKHLQLNISRNKNTKVELPTISECILDKLAYTHQYILNRGITEEIVELFDIGYDSKDNCITFPVQNLSGEVKWIQTRNIDYKFYYIPSGITKTDFIYGAYQCLKYNKTHEPVYVCESPINALTYWTHGKFAVALFGTGGGQQAQILNKLPFRHYVLALDNDNAGKLGQVKLASKLRNKLISKVIYEQEGLDINDLGADALKLKETPVNF